MSTRVSFTCLHRTLSSHPSFYPPVPLLSRSVTHGPVCRELGQFLSAGDRRETEELPRLSAPSYGYVGK
jgi:hypothetical protein